MVSIGSSSVEVAEEVVRWDVILVEPSKMTLAVCGSRERIGRHVNFEKMKDLLLFVYISMSAHRPIDAESALCTTMCRY